MLSYNETNEIYSKNYYTDMPLKFFFLSEPENIEEGELLATKFNK